MQFDIWGYEGKILFQGPAGPLGYALLGAYFLSLMGLLIYFRNQKDHKRSPFSSSSGFLFTLLLLLAPIANGIFHLQFHTLGSAGNLSNMQISVQPSIAVLGAIPWALAGSFLGGWQAMAVGFFGGLFRAAWSTNSLFTPFHVALLAGFVFWLIKRNYDDRLGRALRNPFVSSIIGALTLGVLSTFELVALIEGELYDRFVFTLSHSKTMILYEVIEIAIAGIALAILRARFPKLWPSPHRLSPGPYARSLTGRILSVFLILGILTSSFLVIGNWVLARRTAQELVHSQMVQTALEAGSGIPYFIQTGRSLTQRLAEEIDLQVQDPAQLLDQLERGLTLVPYFNGLVVFNEKGEEILQAGIQGKDADVFSLVVEEAISESLNGIPGERILPPIQNSRAVRLVFLSPIRATDSIDPVGVIAGWTDLGSNPFLLPTINRLGEMPHGSAYIVDNVGRIIIHSDPDRVLTQSTINLDDYDQIQQVSNSEGDQQLIHVNAVEGYSWYVVIEQPYSEVNRLSVNLGFQLLVMIAILGSIILAIVYFISNRFTKPLERMVGAAESITRGNLAQRIPDVGEDEIGTLASSLERMRVTLQDRLNEMDLLLAVSQRVAGSLDFSDFLPPILEGMRELTSADIVRLVIAPHLTQEANLETYQAGEDPGNWATLDQQIVVLSNERGQFILENPSRAQAVLNVNGLQERINALMAFPIKNEDKFVGTIWSGHRRPHAFSSSEINLGSIIAGQLGVAITNADLYQQAEAERLRLKAVLDATPDAVIVTDHEGTISLANPAAEIVLRVDSETARHMSVREVVLFPEVAEMLLDVGGEPKTNEIQVDEGRVLFVTVTPIKSVEFGASGKVCVLWDITHYKKLDTLKSEFVSTVSHDLRMPLTLMRGYVKMLSMVGSTNSQQKDYIQKIMHSADQMARLVDNLLDLGRIEAGLGLKPEEVDIGELISEVVNTYQPQAITKQVSLEAEVHPRMGPATVDPPLLRQAIANLVDNAVNSTQAHGSVKIVAKREGESLRIQVIDNGVGIAPADQARLFEKFYQVQRSDKSGEVRSGLGLAIVKSIVDQHGGSVSIESQLGSGSTFTIEIPVKPR
jgi:PAS domain S-box-containing protein